MAVRLCSGHAQHQPARMTAVNIALIMASHLDLHSDSAILCDALLRVVVNSKVLLCDAITVCSKAGKIRLSSSSSGR